MPRQYAAFISYRHCPLDIAVAEKIHKSIERFKIPGDLRREEKKNPGSVFTSWEGQPIEKNLVVFRDREELPLSNDLTSGIFEALDHAKCLIVVCTPDTPKSLWVRREISYFIEKHGRNRIITVLAAGTPEESIPKEITTVYAEDGVTVLEEYEPLIAYLTADSKAKVMKNLKKELLRLCAAILGCPYDSLRQRHKRRRMQQMLAASAVAFLVALTFIGMLVNRNREITAQKNLVEFQKQQVEEQKQQVEEQKRMVQLRESELLTADAEEALLTGNTLLAVESAVNALPKAGEEDRPYYAPAESILIEAMDILGSAEAPPVVLKETQLEQMTPVSRFCLGSDGKLAVTLDDYGVLHCFDTVSGKKLWSEVVASDATGGSGKFVTFSEDNRFLFCYYYDLLECRDPETGSVLWSYPLEFFQNGYFFCDSRNNRIALIRYCHRARQSAHCLELILLNGETGDTLSEITLEQTSPSMSYSLINAASTRLPANGVFSQDRNYLACAFSQKDPNSGAMGIACFVVDLETEQVVTAYHQDLDLQTLCYVTGMEMRGDHLYLSLEPDDDTVAATVIKLDSISGELLWCTTTPAELDNSTFSMDQTTTALFCDQVAIVGRYDRLYAIDLESGEILHSLQLSGMLNYLYLVSPKYFAYSLTDGTYAIGWYNNSTGFTLSTDPFYQVSLDIGPHTLMQPYGGGIVQLYVNDKYLELSVSNVERTGYLARVHAEKKNQLTILQPIHLENPLAQTMIALPETQSRIYCSEGDAAFCSNDALILGIFSASQKDGSNQYFYVSVDRDTHEITQKFEIDHSYNQQIHFLSDGSGYLRYADGTTWLCRNGEVIPIAEKKDPDFPEGDHSIELLINTDTVRLSDGSLFTAHCDTDSMTLLRDGAEAASIALPLEHIYDSAPTEYLQRRIFAGKNGNVLISCNPYGEDIPSGAFALYSQEAGWIKFAEDFSLRNTNAVAFASRKNQIAMVDSQNQVRLFLTESGSQIATFPLPLPSRSVLFLDFILEDRCLLVKTNDAQVLIYDLTTGEICFHDKLGSTSSGALAVYTDHENQRLYIVDSNTSSGSNCLCVDLRSWTTLGTGKKVLCYDEISGELIHFSSSYDAPGSLSCLKIPSTQELVLLGQQMLSSG